MINRFNKMLPIAGGVAMALLGGCGGGETKTSAVVEPFYPAPQEEWRLVWSDEFDGSAIDTSKWGFQYGEGEAEGLDQWGNGELQWYTEENATVVDGNLVISARNEVPEVDGAPVEGFNYTSSRMRTLGKYDFKYGKVEARIKAPAGQGLWSAFWMLPSDSTYGTWASSGEIDIMEAVNQGTDNSVVAGTLHHGFQWPLNQLSSTTQDVDASDGFHVYSVEWEEDEIRWLVDGVHYKTVTSDTYYSVYFDEATGKYVKADGAAPFNTEFHLLLNLAVGGSLAGEVDTGEGDLVVDYVRVYECSYGLADGSGCNSNNDRTLAAADAAEPYYNIDHLYDNGAATLSWEIGGETYTRDLAAAVLWPGLDSAATLTEMEDAERGNVLEFTATSMGNMGLYAADGNPFELYGYGNGERPWEIHAGILSFDLYVDSTGTAEDSQLLVKIDSGYPALGQVALNVADLPQDEWTTINVKVNDLLANKGEQPLDTSSVMNIFVLESTSMAHVMVDNVSLSCMVPGENGCGIKGPSLDTDGVDAGGLPNLAGTWRVKAEAGSLGVGPAPGNKEWWSLGDADVGTRSCFLDDEYVFNTDGSFQNVLGEDTFLEPWQSGAGELCGAPVTPHDGAFAGEWSWDQSAGTFTLTGLGSYVGLPKANNDGELPNVSVPSAITYNIAFTDAANATVTIETGTGSGVWWTFELVKVANPPAAPSLAGTWQMAPKEGALRVGPEAGSGAWWQNGVADIDVRGCFFDDKYVFGTDGSFVNDLGDDTWLEGWQGVDADQCGTPVTPHDGSTPGTWAFDEANGTITVTGSGSFLGLPKAGNEGELPNVSVPSSITYNVTFLDSDTIELVIETGSGVFWTFEMVRTAQPNPFEGTWRMAPEAGALKVGPSAGSGEWWSNGDADVSVRDCFFDDSFVFSPNGTFENVLGDATWLEGWQGVDADQCGTPVTPHDGSTPGTWSYDEAAGTLTLNGAGSYVGLPKAVNAGELPNVSVPSSVTYNVTFDGSNSATLIIETGSGVFWTFKIVKI